MLNNFQEKHEENDLQNSRKRESKSESNNLKKSVRSVSV